MKLLKTIATIVAVMGISQSLSAKNFYLKARGGYGWGVAKDGYYVDLNQGRVTADGYQEQIYTSIGAGIPVGISAGYYLNDNIGAELDFTYLIGKTVNVADYNVPNSAGQEPNIDVYTHQYRVSPTIIMSTGHSKTFSVYTKVGFVLPVGGYSMVNANITQLMPNPSDPTQMVPVADLKVEQKIYGKFSLGFKGVLGVEYKLDEKMSVFTEIEGVYLNIKRKKMEVTRYEVNGQDALSTYPGATTVNYKDKIQVDQSGNPVNANEALSTTSPYSKQGINLGFTYYF
ncbi:outer membrane beta-barrel protein [Prolixibacter sp. SD074]|jgi:hypothetical protein|uniref:outer membrane beta-barrel protein n=1 Tax=Prolixibacter sp. SD074 TaxID=2652391 RepID=UPI0012723B08|nr:outer membrane beta-barrel protein [Prolixibacter sp. SD074]GET29697.1 hypothetical protein SD074_18990 [Prolixibacter sp. SD074]